MPTESEIAAVARELDKANLNLSDTMRGILSRRLLEAAGLAKKPGAAVGEAPIERRLVGETIVGAALDAEGSLMLDTASGRSFQIAHGGVDIVGVIPIEIVELEGAPDPRPHA